MPRAADPPVGERIREERTKRGVSLRGLARGVGVSASLISQVETGKCQPSVGTLYAITTTLGISVEDVFPPAGAVGRRSEREVLPLDSGVTWERLGHVPGVQVDFLLVTYAPGGSSSGHGQLMRHAGAEYGYLTEGELILTLGAEEHRLTAGQSVCFPSSTPHRYRNDAAGPAVGVWFVSGQDSGMFSIR